MSSIAIKAVCIEAIHFQNCIPLLIPNRNVSSKNVRVGNFTNVACASLEIMFLDPSIQAYVFFRCGSQKLQITHLLCVTTVPVPCVTTLTGLCWLTNTTRTAAYAAVAAMTSFLCAVVRKPNQPAKATTKPVTAPSLGIMWSSSRQRTHIAATRKPIEMTVPTKVTKRCIFCSFTYFASRLDSGVCVC